MSARFAFGRLVFWSSASRRRRRGDRATGRQLRLEPLEDRRLLEATVTGHLFHDANGNGIKDPDELSLYGRHVYADLNGNGSWDPMEEPDTKTDNSGNFVFENLPPGKYAIRGGHGNRDLTSWSFPQIWINSQTDGDQGANVVAISESGVVLNVWQNVTTTGVSTVEGQARDSQLQPAGNQFSLGTATGGPSAAALTDGNYVITYPWALPVGTEKTTAITVDKDGNAIGGTRLVGDTSANVNQPSVAVLPGAGGAADEVAVAYRQQYDGEPSTVQVDQWSQGSSETKQAQASPDGATTDHGNPSAKFTSSGNLEVVSSGVQSGGSGFDIFFRGLDTNLDPNTPPVKLNAAPAEHPEADFVFSDDPSQYVRNAGLFEPGDEVDVHLRAFMEDGTLLGDPVTVNTTTAGEQWDPAAAAAPDGTMLVVWTSDGQDGDGLGVFGQFFHPDGTPLGSEFQVNDESTGDQYEPAVAAAPSGDFVVTWTSQGGPYDVGSDVYGKVLVAGGVMVDVPDTGELTGVEIGLWDSSLDFGDAPSEYPTLEDDDGAAHRVWQGFGLGAAVDTEFNGQPDAGAAGDDSADQADEDGVQFTSALVPGNQTDLTVTTMGYTGYLNAWIDFNRDGDWDDPDEQIITDLELAPGVYQPSFNVPAAATVGDTFARFRFGDETGVGPTGAAGWGEVEDYPVAVEAGADLGAVDFEDLPGEDPSGGDLDYQLETTRAGFLTVQADYDPAGGTASLELFDSGGSPVGSSATGTGVERIDREAGAAAEVYAIRLAGTNTNVRLRIVNLVAHAGTAVHVFGTADGCTYLVQPDSDYLVSINEIEYHFTDAELDTLSLEGGPGGDWYGLGLIGKPVTIADSGGEGRLSFAAASHGVTLDLTDAGPQAIAPGNTLTVTGSFHYVSGSDHDDSITGTAGPDMLWGHGGGDTLVGGAGDDYLAGNEGDDLLLGGDGNDLAFGGQGLDTILGDAGDDKIYGNSGRDHLVGCAGNDVLRGGTGDDALVGGAGNDWLFGDDGRDHLRGNAHDDTIFGGTGNDWIVGSTGNDVLWGQNGDDVIEGGLGSDFLAGNYGNDILLGGGGNDHLFGGAHCDLLVGGTGRDALRGNAWDDLLVGGTTAHDANYGSLDAILAEWAQATPVDERIGHLDGSTAGGLNGPTLLRPGTEVFDDATRDALYGQAGQDWFFGDAAEWLDHGGLDRPST